MSLREKVEWEKEKGKESANREIVTLEDCIWEERWGCQVSRGLGPLRRCILTVLAEHLTLRPFTHLSLTHLLPCFLYLLSSYCSNAPREPVFNLLFFFLSQRRQTWKKEEKKELLLSHWVLIQHAIVPHIRGNRKAIHMQIPISCVLNTD